MGKALLGQRADREIEREREREIEGSRACAVKRGSIEHLGNSPAPRVIILASASAAAADPPAADSAIVGVCLFGVYY